MKILVLLLSFFFITQPVMARSNAYVKSNDNWFADHFLVIDGKEHKFQMFNESDEFVKMFEGNELSLKHAKQYASNSKKFHYSLWGGLGLAVFYLFSTENANGLTYWTIFLTGMFTGTYFASQAQHHMYKAINIYNGIPEEQAFFRSNNVNAPKLGYSWSF
jgi:hypothetical protein